MSYRRAFWGVLLILAGVLIIMKNLGIYFFSWRDVLHLWPLLFILWGLSVLPVKDYIKLVLSLVVVASAFWYIQSPDFLQYRDHRDGWHWVWRGDDTQDETYHHQEFQEPYDENVGHAFLLLQGGAGQFRFDGTTDDLVSVSAKGIATYSMTSADGAEGRRISLSTKGFQGDNARNRMAIKMHTQPVWKLDIDCGAAELMMDLTPFRIAELDIDAGAADVDVRLGDLSDETLVRIDAGASEVDLQVPASSGCEIRVDAVLSGRTFEGFEKVDDGLFRTPDYDSAVKHIRIDIDVAVADIKVRRY